MNSAREQDSSFRGDAGNVCSGVVHMEEEVQDRVQVEVGREEQSDGETHGESRNEETDEATRNKRSTAHHGWHVDGMSARCSDTFLSQCGVIHIIKHAHCAGEK